MSAPTTLRRGRGKAKKSLDMIDAAYRILSEIQPASVRAVCYKLINEKLSERDLPDRLSRYGGDVEIRRIALTADDTVYLGLEPSFSVEDKKKDPRYGWFVQRYGRHCWELDAIDPNGLRERVDATIREYIDWEAWERCTRIEEAERASLLEVVAAWKGARR